MSTKEREYAEWPSKAKLTYRCAVVLMAKYIYTFQFSITSEKKYIFQLPKIKHKKGRATRKWITLPSYYQQIHLYHQ
jgi:hypothetical protein